MSVTSPSIQSTPPFLENVPLKNFCTFGIGGPARYFFTVHNIHEMQQTIVWCRRNEIPYLVLGKGSNCLFDDEGFFGAVILNKIDFMEQPFPGTFHTGAGYSFALLGVQTARKGWGGLEFASGIPASIGGAVYMNAGANGMETCQTLASVDFVDEEGELKIILRNDLTFSYRSSSFQKRGGAIVGATFNLTPQLDARKRQIEIVNKRKQTQPYGAMSAGCVFLNPETTVQDNKVMKNFELQSLPMRAEHSQKVKEASIRSDCSSKDCVNLLSSTAVSRLNRVTSCVHAGALIEQCGLKGLTVGGAQVSMVHANFLINAGGATCKDMQSLITLVKQRVKEATGIEMHSEVRYIPSQQDLP